MRRVVKYVVIPYRLSRGRWTQGEIRPAASEAAAIRIAELMAGRVSGVAAFEVYLDKETGELQSPRLLAVHGGALGPLVEEMLAQAA